MPRNRDPEAVYAALGRALEVRIALAVRNAERYRPSLAECEQCTLRRPVPAMARCACCDHMLCTSCRRQHADVGADWSWSDE